MYSPSHNSDSSCPPMSVSLDISDTADSASYPSPAPGLSLPASVPLSSSPASPLSSLSGLTSTVTSGTLPSDAVSRSLSLRRSSVSCPLSPLLLTTVSISSSLSFSETMLVSFTTLLLFTAAVSSTPPWHPVMINTLTAETTAAVFSINPLLIICYSPHFL